MFLFLRLLLAHFIADFPLQTKRVYLLKARGGAGKWVHTAVIFGVSVLFAFPYWDYPDIWFYLIGATLIHHLYDWIKVILNQDGSPRHALFRFMADQVGHLAVLAFVLLMSAGQVTRVFPGDSLLARIYNSDFWMLYGSLLIAATYFATYFIEAFKQSYAAPGSSKVLPNTYKYFGILERTALFHLAFLGEFAWILIPAALLPRFIAARYSKPLWGKIHITSPAEVCLSLILGVVPGLALRWISPLF